MTKDKELLRKINQLCTDSDADLIKCLNRSDPDVLYRAVFNLAKIGRWDIINNIKAPHGFLDRLTKDPEFPKLAQKQLTQINL